jgi:hypothetical protein
MSIATLASNTSKVRSNLFILFTLLCIFNYPFYSVLFLLLLIMNIPD